MPILLRPLVGKNAQAAMQIYKVCSSTKYVEDWRQHKAVLW